ncbi:hypothetical protein BC941DRAFT_435168 [Chlamydoabsidia padenii]|nr:hypothetical protein BC941DRAFT_435168 [Chlamydoabsidia padenii]
METAVILIGSLALDDLSPNPLSSSLFSSETPTTLAPHTISDTKPNLTEAKTFDLFNSINFVDLIPSIVLSPLSPLSASTSVSTCNSDPTTRANSTTMAISSCVSFSPTKEYAKNDEIRDDYGDDYATTDDHHLFRHLFDLDLLDDYASDSRGIQTDIKPPTAAISHRTTNHIPTLPYSLDPMSSKSTTANIWSNNTYHWHHRDSFDEEEDDEFDPTLSFIAPSGSTDIQQQQQHSDKEDAINTLCQLIPHYTKQQVIATLTRANYDIDHFLQLVAAHDGNHQPVLYTKKRQVCRHFLSGNCHRQDCQFAHDISIKVCRFWLQGICLKEDQCDFAHSLEPICIQHQLTVNSDQTTMHNGITTKEQRRRRHRKTKRKPNIKASNTSQTLDDTISLRHTYLLEEEFPALSTPLKPVSILSPINFAQVVTRNNMKK